ncbi:MAG: DNA repair protein RecO [Ekhidna sp.]|nr:DNA repair protein RecO [Ekhidna sp.]
MIVKSRGIVLGYMKYGDSSIITRVFTEESGYGSYIVNSIRSQKSKKSIGHFQPFSILDLILYVKDNRDLQRISEFRNHAPLHNLHIDPIKSCVTLFLAEVFAKLLQSEQSPNPQLFQFVVHSFQIFDRLSTGVANFHLQFLLKTGPYLGYAVDDIETLYSSTDRTAPSMEEFSQFQALIQEDYGADIFFSRKERNALLDVIVNYYQHHAQISKPKSVEVLRSILN